MGKTRVSFSWFGVEQQTNKLAHGTGDHTLTDNAHSGRKENSIPNSPHPPRAVEPRNQETIELQHFRDRGAPPPHCSNRTAFPKTKSKRRQGARMRMPDIPCAGCYAVTAAAGGGGRRSAAWGRVVECRAREAPLR